ncbi:MAG: YbbC/YhhH family protein [Flavobacteriaceae bacterium]|nr:YbbC/YhhH family protein [Flavobacteriaceae bacterium]
MKNTKTFCLLTLSLLTLTALGQSDKLYAQRELEAALIDKNQHNVIDNKTIVIKDSLTAIIVAEPILFGIYGKDQITKQRPYKIYFIDNYWIINGSLPTELVGGVFLIIIDSKDSKIIRMTHGK